MTSGFCYGLKVLSNQLLAPSGVELQNQAYDVQILLAVLISAATGMAAYEKASHKAHRAFPYEVIQDALYFRNAVILDRYLNMSSKILKILCARVLFFRRLFTDGNAASYSLKWPSSVGFPTK